MVLYRPQHSFSDFVSEPGQDPYSMHAAADYLESMADQSVERAPPLEVHRCFAAPGPSVGLGSAGAPFKGRDLEAVPCQRLILLFKPLLHLIY